MAQNYFYFLMTKKKKKADRNIPIEQKYDTFTATIVSFVFTTKRYLHL